MADSPVRAYARFSPRVQASCLDAAFYFCTPLAGVGLFTWLPEGYGGRWLAAAIAIGMPLLLEPILVARRGTTPAHWLLGLRIVDLETGRPPGLLVSFARYLLKIACLGPWLSPLIAVTARHQALHDLACGTVVEVIDPGSRGGRLAAYDPAVDAITPALSARVVSTLGFSAVLVLVLITTGLLMRVSCGDDFRCGTFGTAFFEVLFRVGFILQYMVLWLGPAGRLPGVR
jgi:uncharacterized RDD family membrane protein YckC